MQVTIRPLQESDAYTSWIWRNDPEVFRNTGRRYSGAVKMEDELNWIRTVLGRDDERRFAIIADGEYVGNIYLTGLTRSSGEMSIFIGEKSCWNRGVGTEAIKLLMRYAFSELKLEEVASVVRKENIGSRRAFEKSGFGMVCEDDEYVYFLIRGIES